LKGEEKKADSATAPIGLRDHAMGAGLGLMFVAWLLSGVRSLGFPRDEGFYFHASWDYARWFKLLMENGRQALERGTIDAYWASNHEHPSLMKSLFGLSWLYLYDKNHIFKDQSTAFRFPGILMGGLAVYLTYLFAARVYSRRAGIVAAVLLAAMPNLFFHAHLACFDMAITTMWLACVYVYWRSQQQGGLAWAIACGVMYGLTLETKHNAWILPVVFLVHAAVTYARGFGRHIKVGRFPIPASLVSMATIGPLVFYALWPWMWNDTLPRIQEYLNFHLHHEYYNIEFLHRNYWGPPSPKAYAPIMIFATVPAVTLVLFLVGAMDRLRNLALRVFSAAAPLLKRKAEGLVFTRDKHETDLLLFLAFAVPLGPFFLEKTPIFGGTKHWMPAYPFLAIFAGRGFDLAADAMNRAIAHWDEKRKQIAAYALFGAVTIAPLAITQHSHPFGLSTYTPFVGGTAGGADLGLNRQFWGFTTQSLAPYFEQKAPPNASVFIHDTAWDSWARMLDEHRLRPDLRGSGAPSDAQFSIVHHELHMAEVDYMIWETYGHTNPDYVLTHDGVPIVSVYKR
jgi:hypothetical protein